MERKYVRIDANNIAVVETNEIRIILNIESLQDQKTKLIEEHNKELLVIQEALDKFTELK